jgi:integrase
MPMIKLETEDNRRDHINSAEEEEDMLLAAFNDSNSYIWLFIMIGLNTGLRHSEIVGARFDNFDAQRRRLRVRVKGRRWRKQPLTKGLVKLLQHERDMAQDPDGWIFPSTQTKSGHIVSMRKPFERVVSAAGLDPATVTPHTMRHTAITRLATTGHANIRTLKEFSGHLSLAMVMRYTHAQDKAIDAALDKMKGGTIIEHPAARKRQES